MTILNGADTGPLAGWVLAQAQGMKLIGKVEMRGDARWLCPVLEMQPNLAQQGEGLVPVYPCFPVFLCPITELELPDGAIVKSVETFSKLHRQLLEKFVDQGLGRIEDLRVASSGIAVAKSMPRLVTPPGGRPG